MPFSATTRMSGVDMNGNKLRKGAADAVKRFVEEQGGRSPAGLDEQVDRIARQGGTPLVVAHDNYVLGVIHLKDIVKGGMRERFDELRRMGIPTVMITGDNRGHGRGDRRRGRRRRLPGRGHAGGQDGADQGGAGQGPDGRDDRRRHQRRTGAGPGRRGRGHEHRHVCRQGGRQHGRPRLQPDQADRDRRGRQAAADHPRLPHHLLDRQRRRQVLRDPAGDVRVHLRGAAASAARSTRSTSCTWARPRVRSSRRSSSTR